MSRAPNGTFAKGHKLQKRNTHPLRLTNLEIKLHAALQDGVSDFATLIARTYADAPLPEHPIRVLRVLICTLRRKLKRAGVRIETVGASQPERDARGYRLVELTEAKAA